MIALFDSGYGGLTIFSSVRHLLPQYDYIYLGDNARTPYGTRSFDVVYRFTLEAVKTLFGLGAELVILACNTASAKALRTIQQIDLPKIDPRKRVLGIIRPTVEYLNDITTDTEFITHKIYIISFILHLNKLFENFVTVTFHTHT